MNEAARMVEEGVASPEDIDKAIRYGFGFRYAVLGLLEFIDWGGGDILYYASRYLEGALHSDRYKRAAAAVTNGVPVAGDDAEGHLDALIANAKRLLGADYAYIHGHVLEEQMGDCRNDLTEFGVTFDTWFSEKTLHESGLIDRAVERLRKFDTHKW